MERKLKILKAVLLLRRVNRYQSKEETEFEETPEIVEEEQRYTSCTAHDYSPSHPWDAPGMSIQDFI